jgi:hypothetical protein
MPTSADAWSFITTDSLEKVYVDSQPRPLDRAIPYSVFLGETASFQVAFRPPLAAGFRDHRPVRFEITGDSSRFTSCYDVALVPCSLMAFPGHDQGYDRDVAGLYPDVLWPLTDGLVAPLFGAWRAVWVDLQVDEAEEARVHEIRVRVTTGDGKQVLFEDTIIVEVLPIELPALEIVNCQWLYCDSLADYYDVAVFSEEHWTLIDNFMAKAVEMGTTSVLTPTWTPPICTEIGHTLRKVQLIGIAVDNGTYSFDFDKLGRWLDLCVRNGLKTVEIAHLFTQWGAEKTPAIYVDEGDGEVMKFGWHVAATDPSYRELLVQLIPQLRDVLTKRWPGTVVYHISDEPDGAEGLLTYGAARDVVIDLLLGCKVVDALSDFRFYESGIVPNPVVATDALAPYLTAGVDDLWVYYCVGQHRDVANRFISQPSVRNRVIGHQLFAFEAAGFLHWGFNYYYSYLSERAIDPFKETCAGGAFLAGDAFIVYPGQDGHALASIRFKVFAAAMADYRAMQALRDLAGRDAVMRAIDTDGKGGHLTFESFSYEPDHYRRSREELNRQIASRTRSQ